MAAVHDGRGPRARLAVLAVHHHLCVVVIQGLGRVFVMQGVVLV